LCFDFVVVDVVVRTGVWGAVVGTLFTWGLGSKGVAGCEVGSWRALLG